MDGMRNRHLLLAELLVGLLTSRKKNLLHVVLPVAPVTGLLRHLLPAELLTRRKKNLLPAVVPAAPETSKNYYP